VIVATGNRGTAARAPEGRRFGPERPFIIVSLVAIHVAVALVLFVRADELYGSDGIERYSDLAGDIGRPYRDIEVEYPIADYGLIRLLATVDVERTYRVVVIVGLIGDLACASAVAYGWGAANAARYLLLMLPLLLLIFLGDDIVWLAATTLSLALMHRGQERIGGAALGLAALGRIWPIVLVPTVVVPSTRRALTPFLGVLAGGAAIWVAVGGIRGPAQVLTFRGAHGWEVESLIGATIWVLSGRSTVVESGAPRIGHALAWHRLALGTILVIGLIAIGRRARRWAGEPEGVPALAAVALLLVVSPLFGLAYASWLVPWSALAWDEDAGRPFAVAAVAVVLLTGLLAALYVTTSTVWLEQVLVLARGAPCLAIVAGLFWATRRPESHAEG
jgi:hypothetical protein